MDKEVMKKLELVHDTLIEIEPLTVSEQEKLDQELIKSIEAQMMRVFGVPASVIGDVQKDRIYPFIAPGSMTRQIVEVNISGLRSTKTIS